jgi:kumamolisin
MTSRAHMVPISGSYRAAVPQAKLVEKASPGERIQVSIYARQNPKFLSATRTQDELSLQVPGKRKYLTGDEFNQCYGADPEDMTKITAWAKACKLKVLDSNAPKRRVLVEGTVADIESAFGVQLNEYDHPQSGHYRGREGEIHVPAELSGIVEGVFGLDNRHVGHARNRPGRALPVPWREVEGLKTAQETKKGVAAAASTPAAPFPGAFFPPQVASVYNYPRNTDGSNQNIGIFAFNGGSTPDPHGGYSLDALNTYFKKVLGGQTPKITDVVVHGAGNNPGADTDASGRQGDATGEVMLDMCVVGSVAPGANIFMLFSEFTTQGWVDAIQEAVAGDRDLSVISISYGNPEDDPQGAWTKMGVKFVNQAFQAAAARGITICCASGDDGSSDQVPSGAHVDFPASSPFVLGVGGTKLVASDGANPTITEETVWNEELIGEGAGGGGISAIFTKPAYQNSVSVPVSVTPPHRVGRGVPDVAAVADPETGVVRMNVDGVHLEPTGGTSAAAPLWAALVTRLNQKLATRCGFLNPVLYAASAKGVLHDITQGNNGAFSAGSGWDACTGLGTPDGEKLLNALSSAAVSGPHAVKTGAAAAAGKEGAA